MELRQYTYSDIEVKTGTHESDFMKNFLRDEFLGVLRDKELKSSSLYIHSSYAYESNEYIELGLYITNTSHNNIIVKGIPITIINNKNKINEILNVNKEIEKNSTIFSELKIKKVLLKEFYDLNSFKIVVGNLSSLEKYKPIELELNIEPKFRGYITKREFNKFIKSLPKINEESLAVNIFKKMYIEEGYFISLIIRNSSNRDVTIASLPIVVKTAGDLIIHEGTITFNDNSCVVPSNKVVLKNIIIPFSQIPLLKQYNGADFKVFFKNLQ